MKDIIEMGFTEADCEEARLKGLRGKDDIANYLTSKTEKVPPAAPVNGSAKDEPMNYEEPNSRSVNDNPKPPQTDNASAPALSSLYRNHNKKNNQFENVTPKVSVQYDSDSSFRGDGPSISVLKGNNDSEKIDSSS